MEKRAFVTLLYNDSYLPGVLVLAHRLREISCNEETELCVMITNNVGSQACDALKPVYDQICLVDTVHGTNCQEQFGLLNRPELGDTFTKIHAWRLQQYSKCVFLDADILVLKDIQDLFDVKVGQYTIAGAPDVGWPDIFNSGVFVFQPSDQVYQDLHECAQRGETFDGGDQGLLNQYFTGQGRSWVRIPFTFNVTPSMAYQYTPAFRYFRDRVSVIHFTGTQKPWDGRSDEFAQQWTELSEKYEVIKKTVKKDEGEGDREKQTQVAKPKVDAQYDAFGGYKESKVEIARPEASRWDATKMQPPRLSLPEAPKLKAERYENVWDRNEPRHRHGHHYHGPHVHFGEDEDDDDDGPISPTHEIIAEYITERDELEDEKERIRRTQLSFGPSVFKFPWESQQAKPERVFEEDAFKENQEPADEESDEAEVEEEEEEETEESEQEEKEGGGYDADVAGEAEDEMRLGLGPSTLENFKQSANAWDEDPYIQSYVSQVRQKASSDQDSSDSDDDNDDTVVPKFKTGAKTPGHRYAFPVTPNPVRENNENDGGGDNDDGYDSESSLKGAQWDPAAQLDELAKLPTLLMQQTQSEHASANQDDQLQQQQQQQQQQEEEEPQSGSSSSSLSSMSSVSSSDSVDVVRRKTRRREKRIAELARVYEKSDDER